MRTSIAAGFAYNTFSYFAHFKFYGEISYSIGDSMRHKRKDKSVVNGETFSLKKTCVFSFKKLWQENVCISRNILASD